MGEGLNQTGKSLPLQDWLWQLDCIQERLAQLLPERDLYVGLSLELVQDRITNLGPSDRELATFPFGDALQVISVFVSCRPESASGIPWLDLRKQCLNLWRLIEPQDWFIELNYKALACLLTNPVMARARTWYYHLSGRLGGEAATRDIRQQRDVLSEILYIQDALVQACALAPDPVVGSLGGDRSAFGCDPITAAQRAGLWDWLTVLSYMALHQMHPLLYWWVADPSWHALDPLGEPEFSTINQYWIAPTTDFRTATEYGITVLQQLATRTGEAKTNGQGQARAGRASATGFTDTEEYILEALGDEHMTGPILLKKAGYSYSSHYRTILSNLVKRGILGNDHTGYFRNNA